MTQNNGLLGVNDRAMDLRGTSLGMKFHVAVFVSRRLLSPDTHYYHQREQWNTLSCVMVVYYT